MGAAEKGPTEAEKDREGRFFKQVKEESTHFRDAERDHHGKANPRCCLKALSVLDCDGEGFHVFFSSPSPLWGMNVCVFVRKTMRKA
jgi:hypothetical protein